MFEGFEQITNCLIRAILSYGLRMKERLFNALDDKKKYVMLLREMR